jgi:Ca-activated chloride channel homolog
VPPDRLTAAKQAARAFVAGLPGPFNVGVVGFAGTASVFVPPTTDRDTVAAGIDRLAEGSAGEAGTAIGDAIGASLGSLADGAPARVVILSDGANTSGQDPAQAAAAAAQRGVPVDSISFGTAGGTIGGDGPGAGQAVPVDGSSLRSVAEVTGGSYFAAGDAAELRDAYSDIGSVIGYETEVRDVSARFIGIGLVLAVLAALASLFWFARLP